MHASPRGLLVVALCLVLPLSACGKKKGGPGAGGFQMPPMPVEMAEVHPDVLRDQFHAVGGIEAAETIEVVSEINATVRSMPFTEGGAVARGALLAQLDDRELAAAAARANALHEQTALSLSRAEKLFAQQAISGQSLDDARAAAQVAEANAKLAQAQWQKTRVVAPFGGIVGHRRVSPGAYLKAGDVITDLARVDVVKVTFGAPEEYLPHLKRGARVEVSTPAFSDEVFTGHVSVVDPIVDPTTRAVHVIAEVANPHHRLVPGLSANVALTLSERAGALVVNDEAVFAEGTQNFVYVVKGDGTVARTPVQLGTRDGTNVEIVGGVAAGTKVVAAGHQKLFDGAKVMAMPAGGGAPQPGSAGGGKAATQ